MQIKELRILNTENPIGIGKRPYFSWKMESDEKNTMQTKFQLKITNEHGNLLMDTGMVASEKNAYIPYDGEPLESNTQYQVYLTIQDNYGNTANKEGSFTTALLNREDWKAKWIVAGKKRKKNKPGFRKQYPSTLFRQEIQIEKGIKRANIFVTVHGVYELYINGMRTDDRQFAPEHTVYEKYLCFQTYDITKLLQNGKNVIGMHVGDGWYFCPNTKPNMKIDYQHAVLYQMIVEYTDGTTQTFISDETACTTEGPVLSADMFAGEAYDANRKINHWAENECTEGKWTQCKIKNYGYQNLIPQNSDKIVAIKELNVKQILQSPKGECILDFGQNLAGYVKMKLHLAKGQVIRLEHGEVLDKDGNFYNNIMSAGGAGNGCDQTDEYISNGIECIYAPHFTYHGFRFVKVMIDGKTPQDLNPDDFTAVALSTEKENVGTFCCSDENLNQLYSNIRWSQYSNMISIPTDCPQREKAGWTGDMLVYAKTAMQNEDCTLMFSRWLENMEMDQDEYGIVPMVVPENGNYPMTGKLIMLSGGVKGKGTSSGWGDAAVIVPYSMYEVTGNTEILKKQYFCMRRWCNYVIGQAKKNRPKNCKRPDEIEQYLWDTGYHYGEWLIPSQNKNGMDMKNLGAIMASSSCYTAPIFGWLSVKTFADIIHILEQEEPENALYAADYSYYKEIADHMKTAIQEGIIGEDGTMPSELMGAYVLPIYFELVPEDKKTAVAEKLISIIEKNDFCMDTGFLASPYLLDALSKIGRNDIAYQLLFQEKAPSWLSEVRQGATTIWENCFGYDADGNPGNLSFNHYASGAVADWIYRNVNGIIPLEAGYTRVKILPVLSSYMDSAKRTFETNNGLLSVDWKLYTKEEKTWYHIDVQIPCNTKAVIVMPSGVTYEVGSGEYSYEETLCV